jgi:DNA-binding protein HU-beta
MSSIKKSIADEDAVFLRGFGTFNFKVRKEKLARNISKNTSVLVPEHKVVSFKPSPEFTKALH